MVSRGILERLAGEDVKRLAEIKGSTQSAPDCGVQYGFQSLVVPLMNQTDIHDDPNEYGEYTCNNQAQQVELGKAVQLVVHLHSNSPASVSSSLIIPLTTEPLQPTTL